MPSEQATPLVGRDLAYSSCSTRLNVSLGNYALDAMLTVASPFPSSEKLRILCPPPFPLLIYSFSVFPVVATPAGLLLLKFESTLLSVLSLCLLSALDAMSLIPLMAVLGVPTLMHSAHLVRVLATPFAHISARFSRMLFAPFALPFALILPLLGAVLSVPLFLVLAMVGANSLKISSSILSCPLASSDGVFVRHPSIIS